MKNYATGDFNCILIQAIRRYVSFKENKNPDEIKVVLMSLLTEESLLQTCSNSYVYVSIPEDQTPPSVLTTLTCTDADSGASGTLTYSIVSGNAAGAFDVQNNGGNCDVRLVTGGIIDFDTTSNSAFQVT